MVRGAGVGYVWTLDSKPWGALQVVANQREEGSYIPKNKHMFHSSYGKQNTETQSEPTSAMERRPLREDLVTVQIS